MSVADVPTLIKSKAYAASGIGLGRTEKDMDDLVSLIRSLGITDLVSATKAFPWLNDAEFSDLVPRLDVAMIDRDAVTSEVKMPARTPPPTISRGKDEGRPGL